MQAFKEPRWSLAAGQALLHYGQGSEYLVYNDLSGDTHLLDKQAMCILIALKAGPLSETQLLELLKLPEEDRYERLADLLAGLLLLSLVRPA